MYSYFQKYRLTIHSTVLCHNKCYCKLFQQILNLAKEKISCAKSNQLRLSRVACSKIAAEIIDAIGEVTKFNEVL